MRVEVEAIRSDVAELDQQLEAASKEVVAAQIALEVAKEHHNTLLKLRESLMKAATILDEMPTLKEDVIDRVKADMELPF